MKSQMIDTDTELAHICCDMSALLEKVSPSAVDMGYDCYAAMALKAKEIERKLNAMATALKIKEIERKLNAMTAAKNKAVEVLKEVQQLGAFVENGGLTRVSLDMQGLGELIAELEKVK